MIWYSKIRLAGRVFGFVNVIPGGLLFCQERYKRKKKYTVLIKKPAQEGPPELQEAAEIKKQPPPAGQAQRTNVSGVNLQA